MGKGLGERVRIIYGVRVVCGVIRYALVFCEAVYGKVLVMGTGVQPYAYMCACFSRLCYHKCIYMLVWH